MMKTRKTSLKALDGDSIKEYADKMMETNLDNYMATLYFKKRRNKIEELGKEGVKMMIEELAQGINIHEIATNLSLRFNTKIVAYDVYMFIMKNKYISTQMIKLSNAIAEKHAKINLDFKQQLTKTVAVANTEIARLMESEEEGRATQIASLLKIIISAQYAYQKMTGNIDQPKVSKITNILNVYSDKASEGIRNKILQANFVESDEKHKPIEVEGELNEDKKTDNSGLSGISDQEGNKGSRDNS